MDKITRAIAAANICFPPIGRIAAATNNLNAFKFFFGEKLMSGVDAKTKYFPFSLLKSKQHGFDLALVWMCASVTAIYIEKYYLLRVSHPSHYGLL